MKKYPNRALRNLLLQLRLVSNRDLFLLLLGKVEMMASTDPGAAKFLKTYGPHGWLATPSEWQRSYLHGLPTTSIVVERVHRECKRVWFSYRFNVTFFHFTFLVLSAQDWTANTPLSVAVDKMRVFFKKCAMRRHGIEEDIAVHSMTAQQSAYNDSHRPESVEDAITPTFLATPSCDPRTCEVRCAQCPPTWPCLHSVACGHCLDYGMKNVCAHCHSYPDAPAVDIPYDVAANVNPCFPTYGRVASCTKKAAKNENAGQAANEAETASGDVDEPIDKPSSSGSGLSHGAAGGELPDGASGGPGPSGGPAPPLTDAAPLTPASAPSSSLIVTDLQRKVAEYGRVLEADFAACLGSAPGSPDREADEKRDHWQDTLCASVDKLSLAMKSKKFRLTSGNSCRVMNLVVTKMISSISKETDFSTMNVVAAQPGYINFKAPRKKPTSSAAIPVNMHKQKTGRKFDSSLSRGPLLDSISTLKDKDVSNELWSLLVCWGDDRVKLELEGAEDIDEKSFMAKLHAARVLWTCSTCQAHDLTLATKKFVTCLSCAAKHHSVCAMVTLTTDKHRMDKVPPQWVCQSCPNVPTVTAGKRAVNGPSDAPSAGKRARK